MIINGRNGVIAGNVVIGGSGSFDPIEGDGVEQREHRNLQDAFHAVDASGISQLEIVCGKPNQGIDLQADRNILSLIETRVHDGVLKIQPRAGVSFSPHVPIRVALLADTLDGLTASGQVQTTVAEVRTHSLDVDVSGQSSLRVTGQAQAFSLDVSGQSRVDAQDFKADRVTAEASGMSRVVVSPQQKLDADASGMSEVAYFGTPLVQPVVSGMSRVLKLG